MYASSKSHSKADTAGRESEVREVRTVESFPSFTSEPGEWLAIRLTGREFTWWRWGAPHRIAVNARQGLGQVVQYTGSPMLRVSSVGLRSEHFAVKVPMIVRDGRWVKEHTEWFEGAALVGVDWVAVERLSREVKVESAMLAN